MEENLEHSEWMKGIKDTGFTTPSNYFEELNDSIQVRVATERLKSVAGKDGYSVPEGYFEQLQSAVLAKTSGAVPIADKPKVVRLWRSSLLKYASAACFVLVAGAGIFFNYGQPEVKPNAVFTDAATEQMLFDIDEEVIIEHIEANYQEEKKTSTADAALENYILNNYSQNDLSGNL